MRRLLAVAALWPALALGAPSSRDWEGHVGERVTVRYVDGSEEIGTVVAVEGDQVRLRKDDGAVSMIPMSVVSAIDAPAAGSRPSDPEAPGPPPEPVAVPKQRSGPQIGLGVGVGMGPVSVGVGGTTGRRTELGPPQPVGVGGRYKRNIVGVRYPMRGQETIDWLLFDDDGAVREVPPDLDRPRALREYVFVDEWGQAVPAQTVWAGMGAERDYILEVKRINRTMIPLHTAETVMVVGGLGLLAGTYVNAVQNDTNPYVQPGWVAGSALIVGNIVFDLAVTGPIRNKLKADLGRKGLARAQAHYQP